EANGIVYYSSAPNPILGKPLPNEQPDIMAFNMSKRKSETIVKGSRNFGLSADGKSMLYVKHKDWYIRPANTSDKKGSKLDLSHMNMWVDPRVEWTEMYWQAWRLYRNFFFNPKMNGKDWKAIGKRYAKLLPLA